MQSYSADSLQIKEHTCKKQKKIIFKKILKTTVNWRGFPHRGREIRPLRSSSPTWRKRSAEGRRKIQRWAGKQNKNILICLHQSANEKQFFSSKQCSANNSFTLLPVFV
jgi:hypothetical protein